MPKYVTDTKAGQSISAWVILNPKNEYIAKIQAYFSPGGSVSVDCWDYSPKETANFQRGLPVDRIAIYGEETDALGHRDFKEWQYWVKNDHPKNTYFAAGIRESEIKENPDNYTQISPDNVQWVYRDCYKRPGLEYLSALGYKVLQAI